MGYERLNLKTGQVITEDVFAHLEDGIEGAANAVLMTPILYANLVALRDAGQLKAGMFYRITDYVTTTIQKNTQSAGHAFDVIVMATDSQTLSEEARAIVHEGDTYFTEAGANLAAWKVWYCLDNDAERFAWADAENGKGVIYRLIDEWGNDCPQDFKNIQSFMQDVMTGQLVGGYTFGGDNDASLSGSATNNIITNCNHKTLCLVKMGANCHNNTIDSNSGARYGEYIENCVLNGSYTYGAGRPISFIKNAIVDYSASVTERNTATGSKTQYLQNFHLLPGASGESFLQRGKTTYVIVCRNSDAENVQGSLGDLFEVI